MMRRLQKAHELARKRASAQFYPAPEQSKPKTASGQSTKCDIIYYKRKSTEVFLCAAYRPFQMNSSGKRHGLAAGYPSVGESRIPWTANLHKAPFAAAFSMAAQGEYTLYIPYIEEIFDGLTWQAAEPVRVEEYSFTVKQNGR